MRQIIDHVVNPVNDQIRIEVLDPPGPGGANHVYALDGMNMQNNAALLHMVTPDIDKHPIDKPLIVFQCGGIADAGVNGVTQEILLAIVIDRLRSFQAGPFKCRENAIALTKIEEAMHWLQQRTIARMRRGVEGTNQV